MKKIKNINKVLVCITPQSNSVRLINKGDEMAKASNAQLHILHIIIGDDLFKNPETTQLLQQLFDYGAKLGGIVHGVAGEKVVDTIVKFVGEEKITHILIGEAPYEIPEKSNDIYAKLMTLMPYLEIEVLERE